MESLCPKALPKAITSAGQQCFGWFSITDLARGAHALSVILAIPGCCQVGFHKQSAERNFGTSTIRLADAVVIEESNSNPTNGFYVGYWGAVRLNLRIVAG